MNKRYLNNNIPAIRLNKIQLAAKNEVERKIKDNQYKLEYVDCAICNSKESNSISYKDRFGLENKTVICKKCGLVYLNPRMNQMAFNEFYDKEYRKLYRGKLEPDLNFFENQFKKGEKIFSYLNKTLGLKPKNLKVLEIGCGAGGILKYFKDQGCIIKGLDLGSEYINYGKKNQGLDLQHGSIFALQEDFKPDIIIYSHVLEHVLDIEKELKKVAAICSKDSIVYIEVPGIKYIHTSFKKDMLVYLQNAHVYNFSLTTLKNLMGKYGFNLIKGDEQVRSIFKFNETSKRNAFINDYEFMMKYIKRLEFKRKFNFSAHVILLKKRFFPKPIFNGQRR